LKKSGPKNSLKGFSGELKGFCTVLTSSANIGTTAGLILEAAASNASLNSSNNFLPFFK
jgi:hypothetical protein